MIRIGLMEVEGFGPIHHEKFYWDLPGLNIIQANNGTGKTKFINALTWCLFGKTLSGSVEPWEHVRSDKYKGTMVSLFFGVDGIEHQVIRCKNYKGKIWDTPGKNRLVIIKDGEMVDTERDKLDYQKYIEELIGYSFDLWKNSVIFGQKLKRLISETGPNKKKVFDEAFEVSFIPKAKKVIEDERRSAELAFNKQQAIFNNLETKIETTIESIEREQEHIDNFEKEKQKEITAEKDVIRGLNEKKNNLIAQEPELDTKIHHIELDIETLKKDAYTNDEISEMVKAKVRQEYKVDTEVKVGVKIIAEAEALKKSKLKVPVKCPECGHPYDKKGVEDAKQRLEKSIIKLREDYKNSIATLDEYNKELTELTRNLSSALKTNESYDIAVAKLERLESIGKYITDIEKDIEKCNDRIEKIKEKKPKNFLEDLTHTLSDLKIRSKKEKRTLRKLRIDLKIKTWLINDPLSNSGLKAFIFDQMLDSINERLVYYSRYISFQVYFVIDMESARKDLKTFVYKDNEIVPYDDLSGGQQQSVDIVTAFAIHDIVNEGREINLLVMDEVFESLDKDNIEIISELIMDKASVKNIFLVTHRSEFAPTNSNIIRLVNNNGVTSMV